MAKPLETGQAAPGKTGLPAVDKELQALTDQVNELKKNAIVAVAVLGVAAPASPMTIKIKHGLGRAPQGYIVSRCRNATPQSLFEVASPQPDRELWLSYTGSTDILLDFRIY